MPTQALVLALAASIYPPAVAAVIALGRGEQVRSRVFLFVLAAGLTTYAVGAVILYALIELGATGARHLTPSAAVEVALGVLLLLLALRLWHRRPTPDAMAASVDTKATVSGSTTADVSPSPAAAALASAAADSSSSSTTTTITATTASPTTPATAATPAAAPSKIERYLESRRLAFVLGVVLYVLPSPIYIGAVKAIADANLSTADELGTLVVTVAVMLWMVELPLLMLLVVPARAASALEAVNLWFARHGRALAILAATVVGVYLIVKGVVHLGE